MAGKPTGNGVFGPVAGQPDPSATPEATANTGGQTVTRQAFAVAILNKLGYPQTPQNIAFLVAWMGRENTAAAYNPLATKRKMPGSYDLPGNSPGDPNKVQQYQSFDDGVAATVKTLTNGLYSDILAGLKSGDAQTSGANGQMEKGLLKWSGAGYSSIGGNADPNSAISTGGTGGAASSSGANPNLSGQDLVDYAESNFPQYAYLLHDPEVGPILVKAAQENVSDPNILAGMLRDTNWWNRTSSTARGFNQLLADDPATAQQAIQNQTTQIDAQAWGMGVKLTPQIEHDLAVNSLKLGWTQDTLQQQIAAANKTTYTASGQFGGQAALDVQQLKAMYSAYALPIDDKTLNNQVQLALSGKSTIADLQQQVAQQAANFYAANQPLSQFLEGGKGTVQDWAAPLVNQAANILGLDANSINLMSPQWSFLLQPQTNPTTGQPTGMAQTLDSVQRKIQTDPVYGYSKTANGIAQYQGLAQKLVSSFGGGLVSGS